MKSDRITRRYFFYGTLLAGAVPAAGFGSQPSLKALGYKSPNEKLNIASIGAGGKAASDIRGCAQTENIVALCDVDDQRAEKTFKQYEKVPKYKDFRTMLEKENNNIDAVIVTVPDFMHAVAAIHAMERGKHVYVQKPLAHTIWECRQLAEAAAKYKVATQMGNQGYSNEGTRQCAEMIWSGEIGNVTEVHAWTNRPVWPQGLPDIPPPSPVPSTLDWDLWLGVASERRIQRQICSVCLAWLLRFRLRSTGRYGVSHSGCAEHGAQAGVADQRRMRQAGRKEQLLLPREISHTFRLPGSRPHAPGQDLLV